MCSTDTEGGGEKLSRQSLVTKFTEINDTKGEKATHPGQDGGRGGESIGTCTLQVSLLMFIVDQYTNTLCRNLSA